jgi:hypothetical protein
MGWEIFRINGLSGMVYDGEETLQLSDDFGRVSCDHAWLAENMS